MRAGGDDAHIDPCDRVAPLRSPRRPARRSGPAALDAIVSSMPPRPESHVDAGGEVVGPVVAWRSGRPARRRRRDPSGSMVTRAQSATAAVTAVTVSPAEA